MGLWDDTIEIGRPGASGDFWEASAQGRSVAEVRADHAMQASISSLAHRFAQSNSATDMMLGNLLKQNLELGKSVMRLQAMVGVMAQALAKSDVIDKEGWEWAQAELRKAFEAIDPPPPPPEEPATRAGASPYRDAQRPAPPPPAAPVMVACVTCKAEVDRATTQITESGMQCTECFQAAELKKLEER